MTVTGSREQILDRILAIKHFSCHPYQLRIRLRSLH